MSTRVKRLQVWLAAFASATDERLRGGLEALAAGDLSIDLDAKTKPMTEFDRDEFGELTRTAEAFREAVFGWYLAYNRGVKNIRELMGEVASSAVSGRRHLDDDRGQLGGGRPGHGEIAHARSATSPRALSVRWRWSRPHGALPRRSREPSRNRRRSPVRPLRRPRRHGEVARAGVTAAEGRQRGDGLGQELEPRGQKDAIAELAGSPSTSGRSCRRSPESPSRPTCWHSTQRSKLPARASRTRVRRRRRRGQKAGRGIPHAAREISEPISAIQEHTNNAVGVVEDGAERTDASAIVVEQAREAFLQIGTSVADLAARVEQIADGAEQIAAGASSMQQSIGEVASVAEQSSASAEQVSASTEETSASAQQIAASATDLSANASSLNQLVARFSSRRRLAARRFLAFLQAPGGTSTSLAHDDA